MFFGVVFGCEMALRRRTLEDWPHGTFLFLQVTFGDFFFSFFFLVFFCFFFLFFFCVCSCSLL